MEKKKVSVETVVRTIVLVVTLLNQVLTMLGKNPLPFAEDELYSMLTAAAPRAAPPLGLVEKQQLYLGSYPGRRVYERNQARKRELYRKRGLKQYEHHYGIRNKERLLQGGAENETRGHCRT